MKICQREVSSQCCPQFDLYAGVLNIRDLAIQYFPRQSILGDAHSQHAASYRHGLKHRYFVPHFGQIMSSSEAGWSGAHDRNLVPGSRRRRSIVAQRRASFLLCPLQSESLQRSDSYGLVY